MVKFRGFPSHGTRRRSPLALPLISDAAGNSGYRRTNRIDVGPSSLDNPNSHDANSSNCGVAMEPAGSAQPALSFKALPVRRANCSRKATATERLPWPVHYVCTGHVAYSSTVRMPRTHGRRPGRGSIDSPRLGRSCLATGPSRNFAEGRLGNHPSRLGGCGGVRSRNTRSRLLR
jgi:hypothetical protein